MRLLDRYLLRELLVPFGYCLFGFLIFWDSSELFTDMSMFQKLKLNATEVVTYYGIRTPEILITILPIAFLLALLYTLTQLARHHEITAIRAAGVGMFRLALPYLTVGVLLSLGVFAMNELWVPQAIEAAEELLGRHQPGAVPNAQRATEENLTFYNSGERRWWIVESYHVATGDMARPRVVWLQPDGTRRDIIAEGATYTDGVWVFTNVHSVVYNTNSSVLPTQLPADTLEMAVFKETPEQIRSEIKIGKLFGSKASASARARMQRKAQLSIKEILDYKRLHPGERNRSALLDTKLQGRLAAPWTCLVVVLIALPFGAASGRRNVFAGVASSILICFAYFVLQQLSLTYGTAGTVLPWVAAWAPNAAFGLVGIIVTARVC
jgi:lipopolysaccharide export system permease protein